MKTLHLVLAELNTPSAQRDQWFLWCAGQMAHAMIGAVLVGAALFFLPPIASLYLVVVSYASLKELPDFCRAPSWATARDCVQDALFVTSGAAVAVAIAEGLALLFIGAVLAAVIGLWWGTTLRLKGAGNVRR
jgi:nitrate reductase gamma subunit